MRLDPITKGCDWTGDVTVTPGDGVDVAAVVALLTGATVTAELEDPGGTVVGSATAVVVDAAARMIELGFTAAASADLPTGHYRWDVRVIAAGGSPVYPLELAAQRVRPAGGA